MADTANHQCLLKQQFFFQSFHILLSSIGAFFKADFAKLEVFVVGTFFCRICNKNKIASVITYFGAFFGEFGISRTRKFPGFFKNLE